MTIKEAIKERHTVRKYKNIPISSNLIELLNKRIAKNNEVYGLNMVLVTENSDGINGIATVSYTHLDVYKRQVYGRKCLCLF